MVVVQVARASEGPGPTCQQVLESCNEAVEALQVVNKDQEQQITNYAQETELQKRVIVDRESQLSNPLHDPVKVGLGAVALVVITGLLLGFHR